MQTTVTSRVEMIRQLVDHSVSSALAESQQYWIREIFENGFVGYRQFSEPQLRLEMQLRGLDVPADVDDQEDDDDFPVGVAHI
jgi:hypothetical protein